MKKISVLLPLVLAMLMPGAILYGQGYHALHGSPHAGGASIFNNPASAVNTAYKWHVNLFATQFKLHSNIAYFDRSDRNNMGLVFNNGHFSRYLHATADANLFNLLYKINNHHAISGGLRIRSYNHSKMLPFNYVDSTVHSLNDFLIANRTTQFIEGFATHAGWLQGDLSYSKVLSENSYSKLSAGITLQVMKNISGGFFKVSKVSYLEDKSGTDTSYTFTNGRGSFAYSANFEQPISAKQLIKLSPASFGLSLGVEYLVYNSEKTEGENNALNYDWKIGVSLMDIGRHKYVASPYSRKMADPNTNITDAQLEGKMNGVSSIEDFSDSLSTLFNSASTITENFFISHPTRLIINVDKNLGNNFYVNGELSLNFYSTSSYNKLRSRELNLLTITPRWETIGFGAYLPVQYNTQGKLWIGVAVKLGPLVIGVHNLGWAKKTTDISGGGYLMLSIHPFSKKAVVSKLDCL